MVNFLPGYFAEYFAARKNFRGRGVIAAVAQSLPQAGMIIPSEQEAYS
jgi:hypothetical protein